ncbi:MAG TPA: serine hydroxymethyltransferase [Gammaproteobacteria bacterium]
MSDTFSVRGDEAASRGAGDRELFAAIDAEARRQQEHIELIASENYVSAAVLAAQGSVLTNKYADGYPGRRTYRGCEHVDTVEALAIERAKRLFGVDYANVQPYSGSQANMAAYLALLEPGDTVLAMRPDHGGHRTHGDAANFSGKLYRIEHYGVDPETGLIDYDAVRAAARRVRPKLIVAGYSAYPRVVDWSEFRRIADEVGARLLADMAHVAGLVAAGLHPSPAGIADVITTTTHKTLRGPRGGMILADDAALGRRLDAAVFPGVQGGPLMHVIAGKAVALHEAAQPEFRAYQAEVLANARRLGERLAAHGLVVATGGTDTHMLLVAVEGARADAAELEAALERAHIAVNGVTLPGRDGLRPALRLGTPAVTTRGFGATEIETVADWLADVVDRPGSADVAARVREGARELLARFPVYR